MRILHYTESMEKPTDENQETEVNAEPLLIDQVNQDNDSLEAWISRAKRAHELVDAVDRAAVVGVAANLIQGRQQILAV